MNKISVEKLSHAFLVIWIIILPSVFWAFSIEMRSHISLSFTDKQIQACLHFQQSLSIEAWPPSCLWVRIKIPTGSCYAVTGYISRGFNSTFNDDVHGKQMVCLPARKAIFTVKDEGIEFLVHINWKLLKNEESNLRQSYKCIHGKKDA